MLESQKVTGIKIGSLGNKDSLKTKLSKKAKKNKVALHAHIVNTLLNFGC